MKHAIDNQLAINLEKLKGIRKLYRRGNGQGTSYRGRMNSWVFHEDQRQIDYKTAWAGVSVNYVNARGSSQNCPTCDSRVVDVGNRKLYCQCCDKLWDRDELASKNLMAVALLLVSAALPSMCSGEGESKDEEVSESKEGNPPSRRMRSYYSNRRL